MSRILLDQNMPIGLRTLFPDHQVLTAFDMGWSELENGKLLAAAQTAGFDIMITSDQNIRFQQNLSGVQLALVVLSTNHWPALSQQADVVRSAVARAKPGSYTTADFERPRRRRRPRPGPSHDGRS